MERARTMLKSGLQTLTEVTLFSLIIPLILHYKKNEVLMTFLVGCTWGVLLLYQAFIFYVTHPTLKAYFDAWRMHFNILLLILYILLAFGFVFQSFKYRPDITSIMACLYLLWRGFGICELPPDQNWGNRTRFFKWCLYLQMMLIGNVLFRDVSHAIGMVDFTKGFFWGAAIVYMESDRGEYCKHVIQDVLKTAYIQMAPFRKN